MESIEKIIKISYIGLESPSEAFEIIKDRLFEEGIFKDSFRMEKRYFGEGNLNAMKRILSGMKNVNSTRNGQLACLEVSGPESEESILKAEAPKDSTVYVFLGWKNM